MLQVSIVCKTTRMILNALTALRILVCFATCFFATATPSSCKQLCVSLSAPQFGRTSSYQDCLPKNVSPHPKCRSACKLHKLPVPLRVISETARNCCPRWTSGLSIPQGKRFKQLPLHSKNVTLDFAQLFWFKKKVLHDWKIWKQHQISINWVAYNLSDISIIQFGL